jgi:hypothetical protein
MALQLNDKILRIVTFVLNVRNPHIFAQLGTRGFSQATLDEGWRLTITATGSRLRFMEGAPVMVADEARDLLAALDGWENMWFPVVNATLTRHFPDLREQIFANLSQTSGSEVIFSVSTLLDRLEGVKGTAAGALLEERGFNADVRKVARDILAKLQQKQSAVLPELDPETRQEQEAALVEAWAWYREWSDIARTIIRRPGQLIRLGLRQPGRGKGGGEEPATEQTAEQPANTDAGQQ